MESEERIIIRRYTDELAGSNDLERVVQKYPVEPSTEKRQRDERQLWQESDQSAKRVSLTTYVSQATY